MNSALAIRLRGENDKMATPKTKEEALQHMRLIWLSLVIAIPLYIYAGRLIGRVSWLGFSNTGKICVILGALNLLSFFWFLQKRYLPAFGEFRNQPENIQVVRRWMLSWMALVCNAHSIALFGLVFWMSGKTLQQSLPFFLIGALLVLSLWPRDAR
jgi:hypothetical protein